MKKGEEKEVHLYLNPPRVWMPYIKKYSLIYSIHLSPLPGYDRVSVHTVLSLTRDKSIMRYVGRATYIALVLCPVRVSTVPFVLIPLFHQASAFSCHSLTKSRNGGANLDQSWQIMRLNQPVGVKADHLGFSSSLQSL